METKKKPGGVHAGHRERLRGKLLKTKDKDMLPHEILEAILFYVIPMKNTNPVAHSLLDTFGSIDSILNADVNELMTVGGIGKSTAEYLSLLGSFMNVRELSVNVDIRYEFGSEKTTQYLHRLFTDMNREMVFMIGLDAYDYIKNKNAVLKGGFENVEIDVGEIAKSAINANCKKYICVHNHPSGIAKDSEADREATFALRAALTLLDIKLVDSIIVTENEIYSIISKQSASVKG